MNNPYTPKKISKQTKITIIVYIITAILTLVGSIFITSIVSNKNVPETQVLTEENIRVNSENFDSIQEKSQIESLIKSYITASVLGEKEILLSLTTGEFHTQVENMNISKANGINFYSNSLVINTVSFSELEGIFSVKYVLQYNGTNTQQNHTIYTIKENNRWKISNLTNE